MSKKNFTGRIQSTLNKRREIIRIFIIAAVLAVGVNLMTSGIINILPNEGNYQLWIGIIVTILSVLYLGYLLMSERKSGISYTSAVIISNENNRPIGIPRYDFSEELSKVFNASFAENESLKEKWNNERLVKYNSKDNEKSENVEKRGGDTEYISIVRTDESFIEIGGSEDILIEATEFVILDYLSKHLDSYFNDVEERDKEVVKIERKDIPKILIENRVLSTLSKPLDERDVFVGSSILESVPEGQEIVSVYGSDGTLYEKFELVLPRGTEIERPGPGTLRMENSRIVMNVAINFDGMTKNLPRGFEDLYMNVDGEGVRSYKLDIEISVLIKRRALLQRSGWKYHEWVDSFSDKIRNKMSFSEFVNRINWPIVMCHLRSFKGMMEGSPNRSNQDV